MEVVNQALIPDSWFAQSALSVAGKLIGARLCFRRGGRVERWTIVETEAYTETDPASHSYKGMKRSNASMFDGPGTIYIYRSYGVHHCLNLVTGIEGRGEAVLIRALEPSFPCDVGKLRAASGPGKVGKVLDLSLELDGALLGLETGLWLEFSEEEIPRRKICRTKRIGVRKAPELLRRWYLKTSHSVSRR